MLPVDSPGFYIINTGHPNGPGEHWTCLYFNGDGSCTYWDSYGLRPPWRLYSRLTGQYTVLYNRLQYQGPFSLLCGLYALFYACRRSRGHSVAEDLSEHDFEGNDHKVCSYFRLSISCSLWVVVLDPEFRVTTCPPEVLTSGWPSGAFLAFPVATSDDILSSLEKALKLSLWVGTIGKFCVRPAHLWCKQSACSRSRGPRNK